MGKYRIYKKERKRRKENAEELIKKALYDDEIQEMKKCWNIGKQEGIKKNSGRSRRRRAEKAKMGVGILVH